MFNSRQSMAFCIIRSCRVKQRLPAPHAFRSYDPRLEPIAAKVLAGERLDFNDGLALYGSSDVLAVGWLANHVRERCTAT